MIDIAKVKLIIWDLDETLWSGIITEGDIAVSDSVRKFIADVADMGIVSSICSKNDFEPVKEKLTELGLWDYFVFPSIDWNPKGARINSIITNMALRPANVLFLDDNIQNLKEAEYFCPGIMTALPDELGKLFEAAAAAEKKDKAHKRLKQYRILENKAAVRTEYASNEEFLISCGIKVETEEDCVSQIDRIHELIMRSNQLNYTKFRQPKEELRELLTDNTVRSGIVRAHDIYGDYGIVGFYAVKDNKAIHFLFSCRTLGMLIEQYVYMKLGCPEINVSGNVVTKLNNTDMPCWINRADAGGKRTAKGSISRGGSILFKGPCDLLQMFTFIKKTDNIVTEFAYTNNDGVFVEGHNHTGCIATALTKSGSDCDRVLSEFSWLDSGMYTTSIGDGSYGYIFLSLVGDGGLGLYRRKEGGELISLCEAFYPLTEKKNIALYTEGKVYTSNIKFTKHDLEEFAEKYEFVDNSDGSATVSNLEKIYSFVPADTKLVLVTGSEKPCTKDKRPSHANRSEIHVRMNESIKKWAKDKNNVVLMNLGKYINSENDYTDSINHCTKEVYYRFAQDVVEVINSGEFDLKMKGKSSVTIQKVAYAARKFLGKCRSGIGSK